MGFGMTSISRWLQRSMASRRMISDSKKVETVPWRRQIPVCEGPKAKGAGQIGLGSVGLWSTPAKWVDAQRTG